MRLGGAEKQLRRRWIAKQLRLEGPGGREGHFSYSCLEGHWDLGGLQSNCSFVIEAWRAHFVGAHLVIEALGPE